MVCSACLRLLNSATFPRLRSLLWFAAPTYGCSVVLLSSAFRGLMIWSVTPGYGDSPVLLSHACGGLMFWYVVPGYCDSPVPLSHACGGSMCWYVAPGYCDSPVLLSQACLNRLLMAELLQTPAGSNPAQSHCPLHGLFWMFLEDCVDGDRDPWFESPRWILGSIPD